ncbi:hypothetical protein [Actinomycetospora straminea]|uniref:Uncharacterized protein n=1 Tax=Actinomycetospora straminea TaxID=663607 RepID=A0ABP9DWS1_9PSEU|nr:hypothetical protein [Actinomycetospora straminea]MDD7932302.1 hypothetical protein [Actinomycetospora straminea]
MPRARRPALASPVLPSPVLPSPVLVALAVLAALALAITGGAAPASGEPRVAGPPPPVVPASVPAAVAAAVPPPVPELPRGGTTIFPRHRVVAFYGTAGTDALGVLGEGSPDQAGKRLEEAAAAFATPGRTVLPAMELIATVANDAPGPDGDHATDITLDEARTYLDAARAHRQLLVLDVQPGRDNFLTASRVWEPLLREPDVGLALDPEWRMDPGEVPGEVVGGVAAAEVNAVAEWLAGIVRDERLPEKLFVLHQVTASMITEPERLATPEGLAVVQHIDGFGAPETKREKYAQLQRPQQLHPGFGLFYDEDTPVLSPAETLALSPPPDLVTYR